jgi:hypothetical protein
MNPTCTRCGGPREHARPWCWRCIKAGRAERDADDHAAYLAWLGRYIRYRPDDIPLYRREWSEHKRMRGGAR